MVSRIVQQYITNPPNNANVSEYCKRKSCWEGLLNFEYEVSDELNKELIVGNYAGNLLSSRQSAPLLLNEATEDEGDLINQICRVAPEIWLSISKWAKETNNLQPWQRSISFSVGTLLGRGKKPSVKQARQAEVILKEAKEKGFIVED